MRLATMLETYARCPGTATAILEFYSTHPNFRQPITNRNREEHPHEPCSPIDRQPVNRHTKRIG